MTPLLDVVLVRPKEDGNVGAVARVARNFGADRLVIVNPKAPLSTEARRRAMGGIPVLQRAVRAASVEEGIADADLVVGTTDMSTGRSTAFLRRSVSPERLAEACFRLGLKHVVVTSVTRDDLPDQGADHFRRCVIAVRNRTNAVIEVLTPDFDGRTDALDIVLKSEPEVFNHNLETVARLQQRVRRKSRYSVSLGVLEYVKKQKPLMLTKSGLMLGLGETTEEVIECMADLRSIGCDLITLGQYLQPSPEHLPVERYVPPAEFDALGEIARSLGFRDVASAPFVRSSYHADRMASSIAGD